MKKYVGDVASKDIQRRELQDNKKRRHRTQYYVGTTTCRLLRGNYTIKVQARREERRANVAQKVKTLSPFREKSLCGECCRVTPAVRITGVAHMKMIFSCRTYVQSGANIGGHTYEKKFFTALSFGIHEAAGFQPTKSRLR